MEKIVYAVRFKSYHYNTGYADNGTYITERQFRDPVKALKFANKVNDLVNDMINIRTKWACSDSEFELKPKRKAEKRLRKFNTQYFDGDSVLQDDIKPELIKRVITEEKIDYDCTT